MRLCSIRSLAKNMASLRNSYPLAPRRDSAKRDRSQRTSGVILSHGRGNVATPQSLVVVQAIAPKDERERRARMAKRDPNSMFAPPATDDGDFDIEKGMLGICNPNPSATFRGALTADSNVHVHTNMEGLSRDEPLCVPCVVQVKRSATDLNSEDRTTIVIRGVQTVVNTGSASLGVGQYCYFDPNPYTVVKDGKVVSGINIVGVKNTVMHPQIRALDSTTTYSFVRGLQDVVRVAMGRDPNLKEIDTCFRNKAQNGEALLVCLNNMCEGIFKEHQLAADMPMRDIIRLFAPWQLMHFCDIPEATPSLSGVPQRLHAKLMCADALRLAMIRIEDSETRHYRDFEVSLPHNSRSTQTGGRIKSSVASPDLAKLLHPVTVGVLDPIKRFSEISTALSRIAMHFHYFDTICMQAQHDYISRFLIGLCLSGANKGAPVDILLGK